MRKHLFLTIFMVISMVASAQFAGGTGSTNKSKSNVNTDNYKSFRLSYTPITASVLDDDLEDGYEYVFGKDWEDILKYKGFSADFIMGFNVAQGLPLYIEAGAGLAYSFSNLDYEYYDYVDDENKDAKVGFKFVSVNVPMHIAYRLSINDQISILPYAGLKARFNVIGKYTNTAYYDLEEGEYDEVSYSLYDNKEVKKYNGDENPYKAKRFLLGWQIGADVEINNFLLGVSYGADFGEAMKDIKFKTIQISLGIKF